MLRTTDPGALENEKAQVTGARLGGPMNCNHGQASAVIVDLLTSRAAGLSARTDTCNFDKSGNVATG